MTSPLPPFPATMLWVGWERLEESNDSLDQKKGERSPAPEPTSVRVDAATWLAGLTVGGLANAVYRRQAYLPHLAADPAWSQPHLASLRPAWEQTRKQAKENGHATGVPMMLDLSGEPLMEWLHRNLFASLLQFALLHLTDGDKRSIRVTLGRVGEYHNEGGNMKTLILDSVRRLTYGPVNVDSQVLDQVADVTTNLIRSCTATHPEMEIGLLSALIPYLAGPTPQGGWMSVDRALVYREAGVTSGEARRWEFGAEANRPTPEALAALAGLHETPG